MKNWMKNIICSREWIGNGSGMDREKSRMTSIKPAYNHVMILTFLFLVLGGFNMNAWGEACTLITSDGNTITTNKKDQLICTVGPFVNTDGVDSIQFKYTCTKAINVYYSTNSGSTWTKLDDKGGGYTGRQVSNSLSGKETANCFKFETRDNGDWQVIKYKDYTCTVYDIKVFRSPKLWIDKSSDTFSQTAVDGSLSKTYTISTYNISTTPTVTRTSGSSFFTAVLSDPVVGCPTTRTLTITYSPTSEAYAGHDPENHSASFTISADGKSVTLDVTGTARELATPEYTWSGVSTYYVEDDDLDLSTLWTSPSDGDIEYGFTFTQAYGEHTSSHAPEWVNDDGHTLSLGKAGRLDLTLTQDEGTGYTEGSATKTIYIVRRDPVFTKNEQANYYYNTTISNFFTMTSGAAYTPSSSDKEIANIVGTDLKIYNKPGTVKIKYVHPQTYKYNEKKDSVSFTPGWKNNQVTLDVTESNYSSVIENHYSGSSDRFRWTNGGVLLGGNNVITEAEGYDSRYIDIHFTGMPDSLSFTYERSVSTATGMDWWVKEKTEDGEWGNGTIYTDGGSSGTCKVALKQDTRWVRLRGYCNYGVYFRDIKITKKQHFKTDKASIDFKKNVKNTNVASKSFKFHHANAGYMVKATLNDSTHYKVSLDNSTFYGSVVIPNTGGNKMDSAVVYLKYYPSMAGEEEETHNTAITFSDNIGNSTTVSVTGKTVDKFTPTITWPGTTSFLVGGDIANGFVAKDDNNDLISGTWSFVSSDSSIITIEDGVLKAVCGSDGGKATITGTLVEGSTWFSRNLSQELTVTRNADTFTWSKEEEEDGKIHVKAYSDISSTIASVNADTTVTYTSSEATYLSVTDGTTLRALAHGEVTLTANSLGDCTYDRKSESKTIVVDPWPQQIIWNQSFNNYELNENGTITKEVTLSATAKDSTGLATELPITFRLESEVDFASIDGTKLTITGKGRTKIIATVAGSAKFASETLSKTLYVRDYGAVCAMDTLYYQGDDSGNITGNDGGPYYKFKFKDKVTTASREITWDEGGCPAYVTMYYKREDATQGDMKIEQYLPRISDWSLVKNVGLAPAGTWTYDSLHLDSTATKLRVKIESGNKSHYFRSLTVVRSRFIEVLEDGSAKSTLVFDDVTVNSSEAKTINVKYSNINSQINLTLSDGAPFTLSADEIEGSCDGSGSSDITLTYNPIVAEENGTYTLTLTDGTVTKVITLDATAAPVEKEVSADAKWSEIEWGSEPDNGTAVVVKGNKTLTIDREVTVYSLEVESGANVVIAPAGGLTVYAGGISGATKDNFVLQVSEDGGTKGQTAFLRISPEYTGAMPEVTMEMLRIGYSASYTQDNFNARGTMAWQYMGAPIDAAGTLLKSIVGGWINSWDETTGTWVNNKSTVEVTPFVGFANSQSKSASGAKTSYKGTIVDNSTQSVTLTKTGERDLSGWNLLANSFAAPIDIVRMFNEEDNSGDDVEQTVYLFNTGNVNAVAGDAGTYTPLTKANAGQKIDKVDYQGVIPAMQGFFVKAKQNCTFTFNYAYAVWGATYSGNSANRPLRVGKREETSERQVLSIVLEANDKRDKVLIIEQDDYSTDFENGYDAHIMPVGEFNIFAIAEEDEYLSLDATNSIIGTKIGLRTGEEYAYTMKFSPVIVDNAIALLDKEEGKEIAIEEGMEYTFYATQNATITDRFEIVARGNAPEISTGNETVETKVKAQKFIKNNCLYIYKDGVLYNALGERVR